MTWVCDHCGAVHDEERAERTLGDLSIIQGSRELWCNDRSIALTPGEEGILFDLMSGKLATREAIVMRHSRTEETCDKSIDTRLVRIRDKLEELRTTVKLVTRWGLGWQLVAPVGGYEQRAFGDVILDLDRRLVVKGKTLQPVYPQVFETLLILSSGDLEPSDKLRLRLGSAQPRWLVDKARKALRAVGSTVEIRSYPKRGFQMVA